MKLKKVLAVAMAVSALAVTTTAFATNATYDPSSNTVSLTPAQGDIPATSGQMTVVVVPETFGASSTAADIYYINQGDFATEFPNIIKSMGLKSAISQTGYEVRVGGENMSNYVTFKIGSGGKVLYGDVNGDKLIDGRDSFEIDKYGAFMDSVFDDGAAWRFTAGNVTFKRDGDNVVDGKDSFEIDKYGAYMPSALDDLND